ncbi:hypothetical protein EVAR_45264_1 [Eumeta japonica]|uniref:Mariner Mos1 transposase n=1 Tax=Eumeta variegata TaxID=151549 RepID=A0A4C1XGB0_EUMVA|nr:hypothetical protein EVAR_45264_1 [Eumeta japonica]
MSQNQPKVARERSASKWMIPSFFDKTRHMAIIALENCRAVNSDWIILHYDNASSQQPNRQRQNLKEKNVELIRNPVYSPDQAHCNLFLCAKIKNRSRG